MLSGDKMRKDEEDIEVNRRSTDKVFFESTLLQRLSDGIDYLRDESREILKEIDIKGIDEEDIEEFSENTLNQISDIVDEMSQMKSELIDDDDIPDSIRKTSINAKKALNRDADYVKRAQRRLDKLNRDDELAYTKLNIRAIELCDKAIEVNSDNPRAYYIKAQALLNMGKYDDSIDEAINSLRADNDFLDARILIADANRLNQDYHDAFDVYDDVLKRDDTSFRALLGKALTYCDLEDSVKADEYFKKASELEDLDDENQKIWDEIRPDSV